MRRVAYVRRGRGSRAGLALCAAAAGLIPAAFLPAESTPAQAVAVGGPQGAGRSARSLPAPPVPAEFRQYAAEIAAAQTVLDAYLEAFNRRDLEAWEATFNFPHVRFASNAVTILKPGEQTAAMFSSGALADWDHSEWARRDVINASTDKVHFHTRFNRYRKDGSLIGGFDSIYIVTKLNGHWGVQGRSSFAP